MINRKDFTQIASHRVCPSHFPEGKKTYLNNVPTIVQDSTGVLRRLLPNVQTPDDLTKCETEFDLTQEAIFQQKINDLQKQVNELNTELSCKNEELLYTKKVMQEQKFCIDRFKHNTTHFKFRTGFESFNIFKAVLDYLNPAGNSSVYWVSNTNIEKKVSPDFVKRGSKRTMTVEEEFFLTLVHLRCDFPIEDLSVRFNLSSVSISRILITWIGLLHSPLRMLPI